MRNVAVHPVNRGFNSIIDATVHATRYRVNRDPELKKLIDYHIAIVRKCGGKKELAALDLLVQYYRGVTQGNKIAGILTSPPGRFIKRKDRD